MVIKQYKKNLRYVSSRMGAVLLKKREELTKKIVLDGKFLIKTKEISCSDCKEEEGCEIKLITSEKTYIDLCDLLEYEEVIFDPEIPKYKLKFMMDAKKIKIDFAYTYAANNPFYHDRIVK